MLGVLPAGSPLMGSVRLHARGVLIDIHDDERETLIAAAETMLEALGVDYDREDDPKA